MTTLDRHTALIVIDLQQGLLSPALQDTLQDLARRSKALAEAFRARGWPVVWVNVAGVAPGRTQAPRRNLTFDPQALEPLPELGAQPNDLYVTKRTWGAFMHTDLEQQLRERRITGVVITGVSTSAGVESTARQAFELGFNVAIVTDAITDPNPQAHQSSLSHIFPRIAELATTDDLLGLLSTL